MRGAGAKDPGKVAAKAERAECRSGGGLLRALLEAATERGAEVKFEVDGGSMLPLIRSGDLVRLRTQVSTVRTGDVVAVRGPDELGVLVHRVVSQQGEELVLRGDNCRSEDGVYGHVDLIGAVTRVERGGRAVWFGSGRLGPPVAWAVRVGLVRRINQVVYGARRRLRSCLKFRRADSRLPGHESDEGNE